MQISKGSQCNKVVPNYKVWFTKGMQRLYLENLSRYHFKKIFLRQKRTKEIHKKYLSVPKVSDKGRIWYHTKNKRK